MFKAQRNPKHEAHRNATFTELTEEQVATVTGSTANIDYDVSTGTYILRPAGTVYVGPGIFVGTT